MIQIYFYFVWQRIKDFPITGKIHKLEKKWHLSTVSAEAENK